jgi:hypothetical protein
MKMIGRSNYKAIIRQLSQTAHLLERLTIELSGDLN